MLLTNVRNRTILVFVRNRTLEDAMEYIVNAQMKQFNLLMSQTEEAYHEAAVKLGLSDSVMLILYTLCCFDGECLLNDITAGASKQTINSALRKLEADDIVYLKAFEKESIPYG